MSNIKISEMTEASQLNDSDLLTIVQSGVNKKITKQNAIGDIIQAINNPTYTTTEGTDLSINNTRVGKMKFEYYGNTEQTTYEGNQLLDFENPSSTTASTTSVFLNDVLTISSTSGSYRNASWDVLTLIQGNADKTLKFVYETINDNPYKAVQIRIKNNGTNTYINLLSENLIIPSDVSGITEAIISVFSNNSSTSREATTTITEPMLQFGTIVKDYEPYTGGIASPNPDYPQEIKIVTGENTITICGKNIFDGKIELGNISPDTGELSANNFRTRSTDFTKVAPNTTYSFTRQVGLDRWIVGYTKNKIGITDGNVQGHPATLYHILSTQSAISFTTSPTTEYIKWYDTSSTDTSEHVMINVGSTALPYEPYQSQSYELNLGKNLLFIDGTRISEGLTNTITNSRVVINGTSTNTYTSMTFNMNCKLEAGTYTFSIQETLKKQIGFIANFSDGTTQTYNITPGNKSTTFTTTSEIINYRLYMETTNGTSYNLVVLPMLEKGSQATSYAPYFEPIQLCKIEDYQDYIYNNGGKWFKHKVVEKTIFNGSENWSKYSGSKRFYITINNALSPSTNYDIAKMLCDKFIVYSANETSSQTTTDGISLTTTNELDLRLVSYNDETLANFKTWLSNNNVTLYYVRSTPTEEEITETTLINQLNSMKYGAESYYGITNIMITSEELQPILKVQTLDKIGG